MLAAYMIRLTRADLEDPAQVSALARAGALDEGALIKRFGELVIGPRQSQPGRP
jgi:hypothetical protein